MTLFLFFFPQWERLLRVARKPLIFCATTRNVFHPTLSVTISQTALIGLMRLTVVSGSVCSDVAHSAQISLYWESNILVLMTERKCSFHAPE